jgi:hypothetical protein
LNDVNHSGLILAQPCRKGEQSAQGNSPPLNMEKSLGTYVDLIILDSAERFWLPGTCGILMFVID